jgi:hypothetical protein
MPVYEIKTPGAEKPRMVKAKDVSAALGGVVEVKAIGAERMLELQEQGITLEKVADATDPAAHAPGGPLHDATGGHGKGGDKADEGKGGKPGGEKE